MLLIAGTVRIAPDRIADALPAMTAMVEATRAEDGCEVYSYAQDLLDPSLIHIVERWRDRVALQAHFASAHMAAWRAAIPGLGITDRQLSLYEVVSAEAI